MHVRKRSVGAMFLVIGLLLWFAPELFALATGHLAGEVIQGLLAGKIIGAGLILFILRKKWIEWVA